MNYKIEKVIELLQERHLAKNQAKLGRIADKNPELYKKAVNEYLLNLSKDTEHPYNNFNGYNTLDEVRHFLSLIDKSTLEEIKENMRPLIIDKVFNKILNEHDLIPECGMIRAMVICRRSPRTEEDKKIIDKCIAKRIYNFANEYLELINIEYFTKAIKETKCKEYIEKFENEF